MKIPISNKNFVIQNIKENENELEQISTPSK